MQNLIPRTPNPLRRTRPAEWDPFTTARDMASTMMRLDPFRDSPATLRPEETAEFFPDFEVKETKEALVISGDLPGVGEKDLDIAVANHTLTVRGKREEERRNETDTYYNYERCYGAFSRSFALPEGVDTEHVNAELKNGVLKITMPCHGDPKAKHIQVKAK